MTDSLRDSENTWLELYNMWMRKKDTENTQKLHFQTVSPCDGLELRKLVNNNHRSCQFRIKSTKPSSRAP